MSQPGLVTTGVWSGGAGCEPLVRSAPAARLQGLGDYKYVHNHILYNYDPFTSHSQVT